MDRTSRLIKLVLSLGLAVAATSSAAAAADTSGAVLTKVEYQQLRAMQAGTKAAAGNAHGSLRAALPACRRALGVSPLLRASKAKCEALLYYAIADLNIVSAVRRCDKVKTADAALNCLTPSFSAFSGESEALVLAVRRVVRVATARKFKSDCVAALGTSKAGLSLLSRFADDVRVLVASMRAHNLGLFDVAIKRVDGLEGSLKSIRKPGSISICPHQ